GASGASGGADGRGSLVGGADRGDRVGGLGEHFAKGRHDRVPYLVSVVLDPDQRLPVEVIEPAR
ncbi:MAG: hypothetical protein GY778_27555, partial [bacterium]|nr:hypothetical protein [bacterium]